MANMDLKMGPRSAQEGPKRLLKSHFFALKNRLKICPVLGPILGDFGALLGVQKLSWWCHLRVWKLIFFGHVIFIAFGSPLRWPKRLPRGPQTPPRAPKEAPTGRQERPRRPQEGLRRPQEAAKKASGHSKRLCKSI